ncbi:sucrose-binding protein-like [Prunus yedoensis var. nudiflora]|uniref:Sucrose-binding protein-like n=1 Tax=Prunus yedoensis var. nudiflora TaxID=2094558 RepID=A0A314ZE98_PRUYE|nr:sucrose-binding protein-like [Prunus yedoensis var. nudiflora]
MALKSKLLLVALLLSVLFLSVYVASATQDPDLKQEEEKEFQGRQQEDQNPYFFEDEHFETRVQTEEGRFQLLQKFTERSDLLRAIENYRIGFLDTKPHAFVAPSHFDADTVLFVFQGRPTVTIVRGEKRESHNLERGDLFRIPAGTPVYMVNRDENEKLFIVEFMKPVSVPGEYEVFYAAGGENPESFFKAFSPQVLQAALKTEMNKLERLFGQQRQGSITRASEEQIKKLSQQHDQGGSEGFWPFHGGQSSSDAFNLFSKHPSQANKFGRLFEADFNDFKQLQDLDLLVSFANITQGAMVGPYFNSRATKISFVLDGEGYFEMASPHVSSTGRQEQQPQPQKSSPWYQKISGNLRRGAVFVAPAGHPVTAIASRNSNLQIICFEVNAHDNIRVPLAGKKNVVSQFDREAKELAFNVPAREVDRIFNNQDDEFFFEGPNEQPEHGRAYA